MHLLFTEPPLLEAILAHWDIVPCDMKQQHFRLTGSWDGNVLTVDQIYTQYYGDGTATPEAGTQGYGFMDNNGDGTYDHMFYYSYQGGGTYQVWNSPGNTPVTQTEWSMNGTAVQQSVFVPVN